MKKAILLATCLLALTGCEKIDLVDGRVPKEYLSQAQALVGTYNGQFNGLAMQLIVSMNEDQPRFALVNSQGNDLLEARCASQIGLVKSIELDSNHVLEMATIDFNPNNCVSVLGKQITVKIAVSANNQVELKWALLMSSDFERKCTMEAGNPAQNIPPHEVCHMEQVPVYAYGKFIK